MEKRKRQTRVVMVVANPTPQNPTRLPAAKHGVLGERKEMVYAMRLVTSIGRGGDVLTSRATILRIVRHAISAGFKMGRGR